MSVLGLPVFAARPYGKTSREEIPRSARCAGTARAAGASGWPSPPSRARTHAARRARCKTSARSGAGVADPKQPRPALGCARLAACPGAVGSVYGEYILLHPVLQMLTPPRHPALGRRLGTAVSRATDLPSPSRRLCTCWGLEKWKETKFRIQH